LAVSSYNLALPVRWGASGSARGGLGGLAAVTEEARGAGEVGDDGQQTHASAAARASFNIDAKGTLEQLRPRAVARAVHALRRRAAGLLIAAGRWVGRFCRRWLGHDEWPPFRGGGEHARVAHGVEARRWDESDEAAEQRQAATKLMRHREDPLPQGYGRKHVLD
jgi:hypothetical protein